MKKKNKNFLYGSMSDFYKKKNSFVISKYNMC